MDDGSVAVLPDDERLTQTERLRLFGPMDDDILWVHRNGATLRRCSEIRKDNAGAWEAWQAAADRGDVDTADLEWVLHDHGVSVSDVRAQLDVAARVLDGLGIDVEWDADRLGLVFRFSDGRGGVIDEPLGLRNARFGPIRLFGVRSGEALSQEHILRGAVAFLEDVRPETVRRIDAAIFAVRHRIDVPAEALDGMTPRQREWVAAHVRLGAFRGHIVAFARDGCAERHYIYDGPDMDGAVRAIQGYVALMDERQGASEAAAMSMRDGSVGHSAGGMSA